MSREDLTELKSIIQHEVGTAISKFAGAISYEIADLKSDVQNLKGDVDELKESMEGFRKSQMDLQEIVLRTDDYIQKELFMNLRELENSDKVQASRISKLEDKVFN